MPMNLVETGHHLAGALGGWCFTAASGLGSGSEEGARRSADSAPQGEQPGIFTALAVSVSRLSCQARQN